MMWSLSACLGPNIILDVTMLSSAEIPQYFSLFRETSEASGFVFTFSWRVFLWKWKGNDCLKKKLKKKKKKQLGKKTKPKTKTNHCTFLKEE